jgi:UDP-N-acetylglucosamine--N-acetylmuramyl-(pentapeptide) pyrophosphoryl-undecaprenol N-acetylglucosamine transferase
MEESVLLAAGGTGGHLFPAASLAIELSRRGYSVDLVTDSRGGKFGGDFPARNTYALPAATLVRRSPLATVTAALTLGAGLLRALLLLRRVKPRAVIGFGGYPTVPPLLAAALLKIPTAIHEQNAVMGRANRLLARYADRIALSFEPTKGVPPQARTNTRLTGAPVREVVLGFRDAPYAAPLPGGRLLLLVFGGSQGAHVFSELVPAALNLLSPGLRSRLTVVQQCREEDLASVEKHYENAGITSHLAPFFRDLPERIANAQLIVSRSGASTVAELGVIGRPAILVPLPHALDNDQLENATRLAEAGGAWCIPQSELSPERLAREIAGLFEAPETLRRAAEAAHAFGRTDSVTKLGDLAAELAASKE